METCGLLDNEYLDKYVQLMYDNAFTQKEKFKTQRHHIIPRCFYQENSLKVNNSPDNLVNLLFKDHILAHCYLVLCSPETVFKYHNMVAVYHIANHKDYSEITYKDLEEFQLAYEKSREICYKYNPMFIEEHKNYHDSVMRSQEVHDKLSASMKAYRAEHPFSEEHRRKLSLSAKGNQKCLGRKRIYNSDGKMKYVKEEELSYYLSEGWVQSKDKGKYGIIEKHQRRMDLVELHNKLSVAHKGQRTSLGFSPSKETREKLSKAFTGRKWMTNDIIQKQVKPEEIEMYLKNGFRFGKIKNN